MQAPIFPTEPFMSWAVMIDALIAQQEVLTAVSLFLRQKVSTFLIFSGDVFGFDELF